MGSNSSQSEHCVRVGRVSPSAIGLVARRVDRSARARSAIQRQILVAPETTWRTFLVSALRGDGLEWPLPISLTTSADKEPRRWVKDTQRSLKAHQSMVTFRLGLYSYGSGFEKL